MGLFSFWNGSNDSTDSDHSKRSAAVVLMQRIIRSRIKSRVNKTAATKITSSVRGFAARRLAHRLRQDHVWEIFEVDDIMSAGKTLLEVKDLASNEGLRAQSKKPTRKVANLWPLIVCLVPLLYTSTPAQRAATAMNVTDPPNSTSFLILPGVTRKCKTSFTMRPTNFPTKDPKNETSHKDSGQKGQTLSEAGGSSPAFTARGSSEVMLMNAAVKTRALLKHCSETIHGLATVATRRILEWLRDLLSKGGEASLKATEWLRVR
mmetsp:Transcript_1174/g.3239  ORF Transcript_1174/g.3239 Transcript_1174/m.3239 type:complete len:263 (-) Transcript_1174:303-1091(-)